MMLALDDAQLKQFDEEGWLFFEDVFDADEVALLNREAHRIFAMDRQEVFRVKDGRPRVPPLQHRIIMTSIIAWADIRDW